MDRYKLWALLQIFLLRAWFWYPFKKIQGKKEGVTHFRTHTLKALCLNLPGFFWEKRTAVSNHKLNHSAVARTKWAEQYFQGSKPTSNQYLRVCVSWKLLSPFWLLQRLSIIIHNEVINVWTLRSKSVVRELGYRTGTSDKAPPVQLWASTTDSGCCWLSVCPAPHSISYTNLTQSRSLNHSNKLE